MMIVNGKQSNTQDLGLLVMLINYLDLDRIQADRIKFITKIINKIIQQKIKGSLWISESIYNKITILRIKIENNKIQRSFAKLLKYIETNMERGA